MIKTNKQHSLKRVFSGGGGLSLSVLLAACGGSGGAPAPAPAPPPPAPPPPPPPPQMIQGTVFDGPIEGATVFRDENGNGVQDNDEPFAVSDADGQFEIVEGAGDLIATGGVDTQTGLDFSDRTLSAPATASVISPITTLLQRADDPEIFLSNTGLTELQDLEPTFDIFNFVPFNVLGEVDTEFGELVLFVNQASTLLLTYLETLARLSGQSDPEGYALDLLANNPFDLDDEEIGVFLSEDGFLELAQDILDAGVVASAIDVVDLSTVLAEISAFYVTVLAENNTTGTSETVTALLQEAIIQGESALKEVIDGPLGIDRFAGVFDDGLSELNYSIGVWQADRSRDGETMFASRDGSQVEGTPGDDVLRGRLNDDTLLGLDGSDVIYGQHGHDVIDGGAGNDFIRKFFGTGTLSGGEGDDQFIVAAVDIDIDGGNGQDVVVFYPNIPPSDFEIPNIDYIVDLENNSLRQVTAIDGTLIGDGTIASIERFELNLVSSLQFTGGPASDIIAVDGGVIRFFASPGNDLLQTTDAANVAGVTLDFSTQAEGVTISTVSGTNTINYDVGSFANNITVPDLRGSNFGDTLQLGNYEGTFELGNGSDQIILEDEFGSLLLVDFAATGPQADRLDLSALSNAAIEFPDFDAVFAALEETETQFNGNLLPSLTFRSDNSPDAQVVLLNVQLADIGPENIILPGDVM